MCAIPRGCDVAQVLPYDPKLCDASVDEYSATAAGAGEAVDPVSAANQQYEAAPKTGSTDRRTVQCGVKPRAMTEFNADVDGYNKVWVVPSAMAPIAPPVRQVDISTTVLDNAAMKDAWHRRITILLSQHERILVLGLAGLILISGVVYSYQLGGRLRYPDEHEYLRIAQNLAAGGGYSVDGQHPTAFRPPGYPAVLSVLLAMGLPVFALRIFNFAALCASAMLLHAILRPRSGVGAVIGGAWVLLYPLFFYTAGTLYPQTFASTLFLLILFLYFRSPSPPLRVCALIGLVFAALILTVPQFILALGFLVLWDMVAKPAERLKHALTMTAACLLVLAPWMVRNYAVFDSFVFISDNSGLMLILGNSENTTPNAGPSADISRYLEASTGMTEVEKDRFFARQAVAFIRDNPAHAAKLYVLKFLNYFNYRNNLWVKAEQSRLRDWISLLTYGPLLALALVRLAQVRKTPLSRFELFALLLYVANGAFSAILFTRVRYRLPFDMLLIAVCAAFLGDRVTRAGASADWPGATIPAADG
jgi:hypothetical protein